MNLFNWGKRDRRWWLWPRVSLSRPPDVIEADLDRPDDSLDGFNHRRIGRWREQPLKKSDKPAV